MFTVACKKARPVGVSLDRRFRSIRRSLMRNVREKMRLAPPLLVQQPRGLWVGLLICARAHVITTFDNLSSATLWTN